MAVAYDKKTLRDFVDWALQTQISEASDFIRIARKGIPQKVWEQFLGFGATEHTIGEIVYHLAHRCPAEFPHSLENLCAFIKEVCKKAEDLGEPVEVQRYLDMVNARQSRTY